MAKKKTQAIIAQPGTPADGYTLDVKYDPENDDAFEATAIFNDGTVRELGSGGSGGACIVHATFNEQTGISTLDKTWSEIYAAAQETVVLLPIIFREGYVGVGYLIAAEHDEEGVGEYLVTFDNAGNQIQFSALSAEAYPSRGSE